MNILQSCRHLQCPASHQIRIQTQHVIQIPQIIKINPESTRAVQKVLICKLPAPQAIISLLIGRLHVPVMQSPTLK